MSGKLLISLSLVLVVTFVGSLAGAERNDTPLLQPPEPLVIAGSPLTLQVGADASIQIFHERYPSGQVFGDGDSGIFFWVNGLLYGSNLSGAHTLSAANVTLPFTTLSHEGPSGSGSLANPWVITTILQVGDTGLEVEQRVSYVNRQEYFRIDWRITNQSDSHLAFDFFHAADLYFADSDLGYGYLDPIAGGVGGSDQGHTWFMMLVPIHTPTHYQEAGSRTIWNNIGFCFENRCTLGPGFDDTVLTADYLDNGVGLEWHLGLGPGESLALADWWSFGTRPIVPESDLVASIPTPDQVSLEPEVIATNFILTSLFGLIFAMISTLFNYVLHEYRDEIHRIFFDRLPSFKLGVRIPFAGGGIGYLLEIFLFLLFSGAINSFLDPAFQPFGLQGLGIFLSMLLSIGLINLVLEGVKVLTARRLSLDAAFRLHPVGIFISVLFVFVSRATEFLPGYAFGIVGGMVLATEVMHSGRKALISTSGVVVTLLLGLGAWLLTLPLGSLLSSATSLTSLQFLEGTQSLFLLTFLIATETVFLELTPLALTPGADLFRWNKSIWFLAFLPVFFLFYHVFLNPDSHFAEEITETNTQFLGILLLGYGLLTVGLWLFLQMKRRGEDAGQR